MRDIQVLEHILRVARLEDNTRYGIIAIVVIGSINVLFADLNSYMEGKTSGLLLATAVIHLLPCYLFYKKHSISTLVSVVVSLIVYARVDRIFVFSDGVTMDTFFWMPLFLAAPMYATLKELLALIRIRHWLETEEERYNKF